MADLGEEGPESWLELVLKLVAVVGIIGMPNAGKNTLLFIFITAGQLVYYAACAYCVRCEVVPKRGWGVFGTNDSTSYITSRGRARLQLLIICNNKQILANNIRDVFNCSNYWQNMRHSLEAAGVPANLMCAVGTALGIRHFYDAR